MPQRYFSRHGVDHVADLFIRDITQGIGNSGVKAAIIKCATDEGGLTPGVERVLRACARTHRQTGVPITTHTHAPSFRGRDQQRVFEEEGVDLSRVIIGHCGDSTDLDYLKELMDRGSMIGMDRLEPAWRTLLPPILLDAAARRGPVLDLRSRAYQAVGRPTGLDDQTLTLRIRPSPGGPAHIGDVNAKRVRGEAASHLLSSAADPEDPLDIADLLATRWSLEVDPPAGRNRTWTITLQSDARDGGTPHRRTAAVR